MPNTMQQNAASVALAVQTGTEGDDILAGTAGADLLIGLGGNDDYIVNDAGDLVVEGNDPGIDEVFTTLNAYVLPDLVENLIFQGEGNFTGTGNGVSNFIMGGSGDDVLDGGAWNDIMAGGAGNDDYYVDNSWDQVWEVADPGIDEVFTTLNAYVLPDLVENLIFQGEGNFTGTGNGVSNFIMGGSGDDVLDGGAWNDIMAGGAGDDTYYVDNGWDQVWEANGAGTDTVLTTLDSLVLSENAENLHYIGSGDFTGSGNALGNQLSGGAGSDVLTGAGGADIFVYGAQGHDLVTDFTSGEDVVSLSGVGSYEELLPHLSQQGTDVVLDLGEGSLQLAGVDLAHLAATDFVFG